MDKSCLGTTTDAVVRVQNQGDLEPGNRDFICGPASADQIDGCRPGAEAFEHFPEFIEAPSSFKNKATL